MKLLLLATTFLALPFFLYWQIESADVKLRTFVVHGIQHDSSLIAKALAPALRASSGIPDKSLLAELDEYGRDGTNLNLMFSPASDERHSFYYVASVPMTHREELATQFSTFRRHGISAALIRACSQARGGQAEQNEVDFEQKTMTSVIPVQAPAGCWGLVISHTTAQFLSMPIGRSYWESPEVSLAMLVYLGVALLSALVTFSVWRSIQAFGSVARDIRQGRRRDRMFARENPVPEFSGIAEDFDALVLELHNAADEIRTSAEDNAHSFKAPLATITAAAAAIDRTIPSKSEQQSRLFAMIGTSLARLSTLIAASQRLDRLTADLIEAPRARIDLSRVVAGTLLRYGELCAGRGVRLARFIEEGVRVRGSEEVLVESIENIVDNAISFAPAGSLIEVRLSRRGSVAELTVQDEGCGVDHDKLDRVFDRYFSLREEDSSDPKPPVESAHTGLGLWIVKRNMQALGGEVGAANRAGGGLLVRITLPIDR